MGTRRKEGQVIRDEVNQFLRLAQDAAVEHPDRAQRYVTLARRLASRKRISLRAYNRKCCRKCNAWFTSKTLRVRVQPAHTSYACLSCGHVTRLRKKN